MEDDESTTEHLADGGIRLRGQQGGAVVLRPAVDVGLSTLSIEDSDGNLLHSIVLDASDAQLLVDALVAADAEVRMTDRPVALDLSKILGRD